jgi:hypothetical protein
VGALSDPQVAEFFGERFVAAHQQVGGFEVVNVGGRLQKNGGNVASYFCTPEGRVIHAVTGPVNAQTLLNEARWAVDLYQNIADSPPWEQARAIAAAHQSAAGESNRNGSRGRRVHELLAEKPLAPLNNVYRDVFEGILGQRLIKDYTMLEQARMGLEVAENRGRPMLLVLHRDGDNRQSLKRWTRTLASGHRHRCRSARCRRDPLTNLARSYVVIGLPLRELSALSQNLGIEPYRVPNRGSTLLIVTRSDGEQVDVVTCWNQRDHLKQALARGLVAQAREDQPTVPEMRTVLRLVREVDESLGDEMLELIEAARNRRPGWTTAALDEVALR